MKVTVFVRNPFAFGPRRWGDWGLGSGDPPGSCSCPLGRPHPVTPHNLAEGEAARVTTLNPAPKVGV